MKKISILIILICLSFSFTAADCKKDTSFSPDPPMEYQAIKLYTENNGETWETHNIVHSPLSLATATEICGFSTIDLSTFCIVIDRKSILRTTNFGDNFTLVHQSTEFINDMEKAGNDGNGFAIGNEGLILMTTDDGLTWIQQQTTDFYNWDKIAFSNANNGILLPFSPSDSIYRTTNGGMNWIKRRNISDTLISSISFTDVIPGTDAIACGLKGNIFRTTDIGATWTIVERHTQNDMISVDFNGSVGLIVDHQGILHRSTNSGVTWFQFSNISAPHVSKIYMDGNTYWILALEIHRSTNGGVNWQNVHGGSIETYTDLLMSQNAGFVVGYRRSPTN